MSHSSHLAQGARYWPLFWTQFLGALNDNLVRSAFVIGVTFQAAVAGGADPKQLVALSTALFVAPFFLVSAVSGQLADKYSKTTIARLVKQAEIVIMLVAAAGLLADHVAISLCAISLMGIHSAVFGPIKYGLLPELLPADQLVSGNAWVELGTFLAILLGTVLGGTLAGAGTSGRVLLSAVAITCAVIGYLSARRIPHTRAAAPQLEVRWGLFGPTGQLLRLASRDRSRWYTILAISSFWLIGTVVMSVLPTLVRERLGGSEGLVTVLLTTFSIGIGIGSMVCDRVSRGRVRLGLVPLGLLSMSLSLLDAAWVSSQLSPAAGERVMGFLGSSGGIRLTLDLLAFAVASGLFVVPLYASLQQQSPPGERARVIAANNVVNAAFMTAGALLLIVAGALGLSVPCIIAALAVANLLVAWFVYALAPEYFLRLLCRGVARVLYRLRVSGAAHIPARGPAVLVCNHVSFVDWLMLSAASDRPIRFVMHHTFMKMPACARLFRDAKVIPISSQNEDPRLMEEAFQRISHALRGGELVCLFPEGKLTLDGEVARFRRGIERIVANDAVPVVPMHLEGLWGSVFSRRAPRRFKPTRRLVWLSIAAPVAPGEVNAEMLEGVVKELSVHNARRAAPRPVTAAVSRV
jgi:1-acyl-sn-glycerol-3-phosphate acyltransferase